MKPKDRTRLSKFLSLVLRHRPDEIGIELDPAGWVDVNELLDACRRHGRRISLDALREVVATSPKRRFAFSDNGLRIRASQGHSVNVDLGYQSAQPPELLYHGTVAGSLDAIREKGLLKMDRHHVHLSPDPETASAVGQRRGRPVILRIRAREMATAGYEFFLSANGVWLTDRVPPEYLDLPGE